MKNFKLFFEDDFMSGMLEYEAKTKIIYSVFYYIYKNRCYVSLSIYTEENIMDWVTNPTEESVMKRAIKVLREKGEYEEINEVTGSTHMFTYDREKAQHYYKLLKESAEEQGLEFEVYGDAI